MTIALLIWFAPAIILAIALWVVLVRERFASRDRARDVRPGESASEENLL